MRGHFHTTIVVEYEDNADAAWINETVKKIYPQRILGSVPGGQIIDAQIEDLEPGED